MSTEGPRGSWHSRRPPRRFPGRVGRLRAALRPRPDLQYIAVLSPYDPWPPDSRSVPDIGLGSYFMHELLVRTRILNVMLKESLSGHPALFYDAA